MGYVYPWNLHCCRVIPTVDKRQTSNLDIRYYVASMSNSQTTTKLISFPEIFVESWRSSPKYVRIVGGVYNSVNFRNSNCATVRVDYVEMSTVQCVPNMLFQQSSRGSCYVLNQQQNHLWATHIAIIQYDAGRFDPKVFLNCRVQGQVDKDLRAETSCIIF